MSKGKKTITAPFTIVTRGDDGKNVDHPPGTPVAIDADEAARLIADRGAQLVVKEADKPKGPPPPPPPGS